VRVVDAKTGDDLTAQMLAQIIFEDRNAARLLPGPLLHALVRMGDDALADFFGRYVTWALEVYLQARQGLGGLAFNPFAQAAFGAMGPFGQAPPAPARPAPRSDADDVAQLRRELDELKQQLRKPRR